MMIIVAIEGCIIYCTTSLIHILRCR